MLMNIGEHQNPMPVLHQILGIFGEEITSWHGRLDRLFHIIEQARRGPVTFDRVGGDRPLVAPVPLWDKELTGPIHD